MEGRGRAPAALCRAAQIASTARFAGLWETWTGPNGEEIESAAIITTQASRSIAALHDRMPAIVPPEAFELWLDCGRVDAETAAALLAPAPDAIIEAYEVSSAVNRVANDSADMLQAAAGCAQDGSAMGAAPVARRRTSKKDDRQRELF